VEVGGSGQSEIMLRQSIEQVRVGVHLLGQCHDPGGRLVIQLPDFFQIGSGIGMEC
jgi:hypothetical protein